MQSIFFDVSVCQYGFQYQLKTSDSQSYTTWIRFICQSDVDIYFIIKQQIVFNICLFLYLLPYYNWSVRTWIFLSSKQIINQSNAVTLSAWNKPNNIVSVIPNINKKAFRFCVCNDIESVRLVRSHNQNIKTDQNIC